MRQTYGEGRKRKINKGTVLSKARCLGKGGQRPPVCLNIQKVRYNWEDEHGNEVLQN
jgi:hypothetical protein